MKALDVTYNEDSPLYNILILRSYINYIERHYPHIDIDKILDYAGITRLQYNDHGYWYNQRVVNRFQEIIVKETGNKNIAYFAGLNLIQSKSIFTQYLLGFTSAELVASRIADIYGRGSRATKINAVKIEDTKYEVNIIPLPGVKEHPNQCLNRIGSIKSIFSAVIHQEPIVEHFECVFKGYKSCKYIISWNKASELYFWYRIRNYFALTGLIVSVASIIFLPFQYFLITSLILLTVVYSVSYHAVKEERNNLKSSLAEMGKLAEANWTIDNIYYDVTKMMAEIGQATSIVQDELMITSIINNIMEEQLEFGRGVILLADSLSRNLNFVSGYGFSEDEIKFLTNSQFPLDNSETQEIFLKVFYFQKPELIEDLDENDENFNSVNFLNTKLLNIKSMICVPIIFEGKSLGVLAVDNLQSDRLFAQGDINILTAVASQTAVSIANARSFRKLQESEKKHRTLVETIRDIVYTVDLEGRFTYLSPISEAITGYKYKELLGRPFIDIIVPADKKTVMQRFAAGFKSGGRSTYEIEILTKGKKTVPVEFNVAPLTNNKGQTVGWIGVARDISRRKKEETKRQDMELKALTQDKLASIGEIATGIAHEINQPLSYIKVILESTLSDMEEERLDKAELSEDFSESLRQVGKITNIISHLRTFGRSDVTAFSPIKLSKIIDDTLILMNERLRIKNIELNIQITDNFPLLYGNHAKLEQVFVNLIQNSMDAMEKNGKGEILLQAQSKNDEVFITYSDTGEGIKPHFKDKIFDPFFTTKEAGKGTGIGLSIVYGIIQEHNGVIICDPEEGNGAVFKIKLPVYEEENACSLSAELNA